IIAAVAAGISVIGNIWVATASAGWTNTNRYARTAEAAEGEFDSAATWDALSRGEDIVDDAVRTPATATREPKAKRARTPMRTRTRTRTPMPTRIRNALVTGSVSGQDRKRDTMEESFHTRATPIHKGAPCRSPSPATGPQISTSPRSTTQRSPIPVTAIPWRDGPV